MKNVGGIVLLGMPGAGKGTQAVEIQERFGIPEISTGEILRDHARRGTPLGLEAQSIMKSGALAPDSVMVPMTEERLAQPDCLAGYILDGYPRTEAQAEALDALMARTGRRPPRVILLDVEPEPMIERLTNRRGCPQCHAIYNLRLRPPRAEGVCDADQAKLIHRADDQEETVRRRIETFQKQTAAVIEHYRRQGRLMVVDAGRDSAAITADLLALLNTPAGFNS